MAVTGSTAGFAQSSKLTDNPDSSSAAVLLPEDSVYYGCVPCCQECAVFKTDKPGECPICGMTLVKRYVTMDDMKNESGVLINDKACKKPQKSNAK